MLKRITGLAAMLGALALMAGCASTPEPVTSTDTDDWYPDLPVLSSAPLGTSRTLTRIAVGSCLGQDDPQDIWDVVADTDPDLFLYIGDNVYGDLTRDDPAYYDGALPKLRAAYTGLAASEPFADLRATTPVLPVWDDHDYGLNDGGADFIYRKEAERIFEDVWDVDDNDPRRRRDGVYGSWTFGQEAGKTVQIIMLDTRFFRAEFIPAEPQGPGREKYVPDPSTQKTMLGEAQWRWLQNELLKPADLRIIVSSIQVIADGHGWEAWKMLPAERERLYGAINTAGAENVLLLSGDRHAGALYRKDLALAYPLYEMTASSLNKPGRPPTDANGTAYTEAGPNRLGEMYYPANFGLVEIDWAAQEVTLSLRGKSGSAVRKQTISLAELRPVY